LRVATVVADAKEDLRIGQTSEASSR
jgi:hypothetical protein